MSDFPKYIILPQKVYSLSINKANGMRAFNRDLIDYSIYAENPLNPSDNWKALLGISAELYHDYKGYKFSIPLEWLLIRFLTHHVRTNSIHIISGAGGEVLNTKNFKEFLGTEATDNEIEKILKIVFWSWVRVFPAKDIALADIYASLDINFEMLKRGISFFKYLGHLEEIASDTYKLNPKLFINLGSYPENISFDRKYNRYYQEINIEANEPFCFIIMPFREEEFSQRSYKEVIKPLVENEYNISCYRVDEDYLPDRIDNKIYTYIFRSAFIIAEVSTLNPNVFYELGLAHMLEKSCIILTQKSVSEIPFDINRIRTERYDNDDQLRELLRKSISALGFKAKKQ